MKLKKGLKRIIDMCDASDCNACENCPLDDGGMCRVRISCATDKEVDEICDIVEHLMDNEEAQEYVKSHLDERTKLEQLAEEANELSQAALKLIRAKGMSGNATPVTADKALDNLQEEVMDVLACLVVLDVNLKQALETTTANPKWLRWANRLRAKKHE